MPRRETSLVLKHRIEDALAATQDIEAVRALDSLFEELKRRDGLLLQCASVLQTDHPKMAERLRGVAGE